MELIPVTVEKYYQTDLTWEQAAENPELLRDAVQKAIDEFITEVSNA